jgi:hypothetical protein
MSSVELQMYPNSNVHLFFKPLLVILLIQGVITSWDKKNQTVRGRCRWPDKIWSHNQTRCATRAQAGFVWLQNETLWHAGR